MASPLAMAVHKAIGGKRRILGWQTRALQGFEDPNARPRFARQQGKRPSRLARHAAER